MSWAEHGGAVYRYEGLRPATRTLAPVGRILSPGENGTAGYLLHAAYSTTMEIATEVGFATPQDARVACDLMVATLLLRGVIVEAT